jgi:hypothetical protein
VGRGRRQERTEISGLAALGDNAQAVVVKCAEANNTTALGWRSRNVDHRVEQAHRCRIKRATKCDKIPQARPTLHFNVVKRRIVRRPEDDARLLSVEGDILDPIKPCRMLMKALGEMPQQAHVRRIQCGEVKSNPLGALACG